MNPNVNIPNFGGDDASQANLATQLSIAKAQKDEKSKEFYTEPIRMASQDMIMTGAKGLAGYLTKKTGLKAFGNLAADVKTHGVAGGLARTAARAGNEAAGVAGDVGRKAVADALETHRDAIQQVAGGLPTSIPSSAEELQSSVASRVSALGDQASAAVGDAADAGDAQLARLASAAQSEVNPGYQPTENRINQALATEQQRTASLGEGASSGLKPEAASLEPAAQQGLSDLGILPKLGGAEQLEKLPSSVAAAKALRQGGLVNTERGAKSASSIIADIKAKRLAGGGARLAATTARRDAAFGASAAEGSSGGAFARRLPAEHYAAADKGQAILDNLKRSNPLADAAESADKMQTSGVGGGAEREAAPAGGAPVQDSASSGAGPTSATALDEQAAAAAPVAEGIASGGDGAPSGGPGGGPDSGNTLANKIDTGINDAQNVVDADSAVDDAASAASKAAAAAKAAGGVESGLQKATAVSTAADETPVGDVITGVLGVASLIGGLFAGHSDEAPSAPAVGQMAQSATAGAGNNA